MGAQSKFHKIIGAAEIVVGAILDYESFGTLGNSLILIGAATFDGVPGAPAPVAAAINVTVSNAIAPMQIVYGETKVSGILIAADSGDGGGATDADYKYMAVAHSLTLKNGTAGLALQGVDGNGRYYLDNNPIFASNVDPTTGVVSGSGVRGNNIDYDGIVTIKFYDGSQTAVDPWLNAGLSYWLSTAIGKGISYVVVKIHADPTDDAVQAAFQNGLPTNIAVDLQGQKVYDPRLDSTAGGSGSQRKATPSTWTYSANPALCLRDYLVRPTSEGGAGRPSSSIPDDFLTAAANRCDESLTIPNGTGGTTTTVRFLCGVGLVTSDSVPTNIQKLLDAMAGVIVQTGGELRIFAGKYIAPVTTIDESWLCGGPTFQTTAEQDSRWNTVNATFTDPASAYTNVQTPAYAAAGAVTADGGITLTKSLNLPAVPAQYNAQYITQISAKQSREQKVLTLPCNLKAMDVDEFEVVNVTIAEYGLSSAKYRVRNWQRKADSSILLTLQEAKSTTYDDETFTEVDPLGQPPLVEQTPPTPTNFTVTGHVGGIALDWDELKAYAVTGYEVFRSTSSGGSYSKVKITRDSHWDNTLGSTTTFWYKVRAKNYRGNVSGFTSPASGTATNVTDVVGGTGGNLMDPRYAIIASSKLPTYASPVDWTVGRSSTAKNYGYLDLQLTSTSAGSNAQLACAASTSDNTKPGWRQLEAKKYSVQVFLQNVDSDANGPNFTLRFDNAAGAACTAVQVTRVVAGTGLNGIYAATLDLTGATDTLVYLRHLWQGTITVGHKVCLQGWGIFEMQGTSTVTPDFVPPAPASHDDLQDGETMAGILAVAKNANGAIDLSMADTSNGRGAGIENADTTYLNDGANLGVTGDLTKVTNLPATVSSANGLGMITDAQTALPLATAARMVLRNDGGAFYQDDQYSGGECDAGEMGGTNFMPGGNQNMTASYVSVGNKFVIQNPGTTVTIFAVAMLSGNSSTAGDSINVKLQISTDGGSTYTDCDAPASLVIVKATTINSLGSCQMVLTATPTGDIHIRVQAQWSNHTSTPLVVASNSSLAYQMFASSNGNIVGNGNLAASIPATAAVTANSTYPITTATYNKNLKVSPSGGVPTYTYSNVKTAGTGSITAGSTSQTFTVSDTETATSGGATHTTTVQSTVTDAQSYTSSSGSESGATATLTLNTSALMAVGGICDVSATTPAGYAKTGAVALSGTTGATLKYTANSSGLGALTAATINNVRVITSTCVVTGTFHLNYPSVSVSLSGSHASSPGVAGASVAATTTITVNATGGDGAYTYANSKTSGGGSITSGSTSKNFTVSETGTVPGTDSGVYKSIVTDGHSNSGNGSKTVNFTWRTI